MLRIAVFQLVFKVFESKMIGENLKKKKRRKERIFIKLYKLFKK